MLCPNECLPARRRAGAGSPAGRRKSGHEGKVARRVGDPGRSKVAVFPALRPTRFRAQHPSSSFQASPGARSGSSAASGSPRRSSGLPDRPVAFRRTACQIGSTSAAGKAIEKVEIGALVTRPTTATEWVVRRSTASGRIRRVTLPPTTVVRSPRLLDDEQNIGPCAEKRYPHLLQRSATGLRYHGFAGLVGVRGAARHRSMPGTRTWIGSPPPPGRLRSAAARLDGLRPRCHSPRP